EPWTPVDVVVWVKMLAWDLSGNYSFELLRHDLLTAVGPEKMAALMPPYARDGLSILTGPGRPGESDGPGGASTQSFAATRTTYQTYQPHPTYPLSLWSGALVSAVSQGEPAVRDFLTGARSEGLGSNNWVVDGTLTASGKPLLANDPHLGTRL